MNAILAIIADGGQAIVVNYREAVEINYFLTYYIMGGVLKYLRFSKILFHAH
jgi:hypothetical protein